MCVVDPFVFFFSFAVFIQWGGFSIHKEDSMMYIHTHSLFLERPRVWSCEVITW